MKDLIYKMLTENTGVHLMDSGGDNGRGWQRNQKKTLQDFESEPEVTVDDGIVTVSTFHLLTKSLTQDDMCREFNKRFSKMDNWDSDMAHGLSTQAGKWLSEKGLSIGELWNTYNGEWFGDQTLQGANVSTNLSNLEYPEYVLLQIHNGADVRGGYTDAKLFRVATDSGWFGVPTVYATTKNGIEYSTSYNGYSLTTDDGEKLSDDAEIQHLYVSY